MQFVNISNRSAYTLFTGSLGAGKASSGNRQLEDLLDSIVKACGDKLGIRLSAREAALLNRLMELDERGGGFNPANLPKPVKREDPGVVAQRAHMNAVAAKNAEAAQREAEINGETEPQRKPIGPATLASEGVQVEPSMLKSGFEAIMEANARIEEGKKPMDTNEALDPIGTHAVGTAPAEAPAEAEDTPKAPGKDPEPVKQARGREDDVTRSADAEVPKTEVPAKGSAMDRMAADTAAKLATLGPVSEAQEDQEAPKSKKGRSRKAK